MATSAVRHTGGSGSTPPSVSTIKESDSPGGDESPSNGTGGAGASGPPDKASKPHKPLNRVPRACNACRKQKMKCTDADNPPCKRCRTAGIECVFEKPIRDTLNNSEQGMRIRYLESQVTSIQSTLSELVTTLRAAVPQASLPMNPGAPSASQSMPNVNASSSVHGQMSSPAQYGAASPSTSAHSNSLPPHNGSAALDPSSQGQQQHTYPQNNHPQYSNQSVPPGMRQYRSSSSSSGRTNPMYFSSPVGSHPPHTSPPQHGLSQEPHLEHAHRSGEPAPSMADHRSMQNRQQDQYANYHGQYHNGPPPTQVPQLQQAQPYTQQQSQHPQQHSVMPPPQSLPPFSALDVPHGSHGPPPPAPTVPNLHIHTGHRPSFPTPTSPRKSSQIPPVNGYNGSAIHGQPSGSQHHGPPQNPQYPPSVSNGGHHQYAGPAPSGHYQETSHGDYGTKPLAGDLSSGGPSADSSDDEGGLPTHGMVAPFVAIRGLADAADRAAEENGGESFPPTRPGSPSRPGYQDNGDAHMHGAADGHGRVDGRGGKRTGGKNGHGNDRPSKRRRTQQTASSDDAGEGPSRAVPDVVSKGLISEDEARELFQIFFTGCSMFLPVFDQAVDTYDALHKRSPFCVDSICMIAAKVRDGGGPPSETYKKCLKEVHELTCGTLFTPVIRQEVVQAMIIIAGWGAGPKDSGWLTCGHATRMALELGINKAWPRLLKRMHAGKASTSPEERELVIASRTWFCLYLFEHQMSFGTGRPPVTKEDESVHECRLLLTHPLAIPDDMRLVSMVELMIIRERTHNMVNPADNAPVDASAFAVLRQSKDNFESWLKIWSTNFSKRYDPAAFHRQSLEAQVAFAELYHNAIALRTIRGPDDVARITDDQRLLAIRSIEVARGALEVCLRSPSYREGMKYAVQYTHLSATFAASFLMRLARLFPDDCDLPAVIADVEDLSVILSEIPATRFARTLKLMVRAAKRRFTQPVARQSENSMAANQVDPSRSNSTPRANQFSPSEQPQTIAQPLQQMMIGGGDPIVMSYEGQGLDQIVRDFELMPGQDVPVWLSESNLGDFALSQQGLEAFLIPPSLDDHRTVPEIW